MKKFYILTLAAALGLSMTAANFGQVSSDNSLVNKNYERSLSQASLVKVSDVKAHKAPSRAEGTANLINDDLEGTYEWSYVSALNTDAGVAYTEYITITSAPRSETKVNIKFLAYDFSVSATFNPEDGTLTIPGGQKALQLSNGTQCYLYTLGLDETGENIIDSTELPIVANYDNGNFVFRTPYIAIGIPGTGYVILGSDNNFIADRFVDYGTALFIDGWIMSAFSFDGFTYKDIVMEVPVQQHANHDYIYRLVDPYKGEHPAYEADPEDGSRLNESTTEGYIKFSIEHPEFPFVFPLVKAGYKCTAQGIDELYCHDAGGIAVVNYGWDYQDALEQLSDNYAFSTYDADKRTVEIHDCYFGIDESSPVAWYQWQDEAGTKQEMYGSIQLPEGNGSVDGIVSESNEAPVYYNLQGARVENPGHGIYIRVANGKAQKVLR